ncbi:aldehyde dehydrogenase [Hypoxylon fragiforme]|uniref:aldehyde dehydrogenase n=1 Tax=Hypoxylon fragiforme TaxID=63214 RepID=UPI0020C5C893|nr:aldehyde dehydrogenase [Hypoxylon fragiforme]KAI2606272.1 aldehyde dehydrogenase [Hypoxylon fragiforme]
MKPDIKIPPFEATSIDDIAKIAATARESFRSQKTKDVEWRLVQLRKLYWGVTDYSEKFQASLQKDFRKPNGEAVLTEIHHVIQDLDVIIKNLKRWAKDEKSMEYSWTFMPMKPRVKKEPLGAVLIIGTYNFPMMLNIAPFMGAIAAGCTAIMKPSENAPATAMVLKEMVEKYLDPSCFFVVNGAIPETTALLEEKWDKILYTGGNTVAKIIAKKAAETLTPITLELGGRNPAFVSKSSDLALAARRLLWGKTNNAGQICLSQNYVLVHKDIVQDFIKQLLVQQKVFYPDGPKASQDYARIINENQFDRIKNLIDTTNGKIVMGGETDRSDLYIAPTVILVDSIEDPVMQNETFGPVWSIMPYDTVDEAIQIMNMVDSTPLSLMVLGSKAENEKIINNVTSGGASINDAWMHAGIPTIPFGGVGQSGMGSYHGRSSFDCFTHHRSIVEVPGWADNLLRVRYPPFSAPDFKRHMWMTAPRPSFDRDGRPISGLRYWLWLVTGLGGPASASSAKGALLLRCCLVVLASSYAAYSRYRRS